MRERPGRAVHAGQRQMALCNATQPRNAAHALTALKTGWYVIWSKMACNRTCTGTNAKVLGVCCVGNVVQSMSAMEHNPKMLSGVIDTDAHL